MIALLPVSFWAAFGERVQSCPWGGIAAIGITMGVMWLIGVWAADRWMMVTREWALGAARRIEQAMPAPQRERLSLARRVQIFEGCVEDYRALGEPLGVGFIGFTYALTREELREFLIWLRGTARRIDGAHYIGIVEGHTVRFRVIGEREEVTL